MAEFINTTDVLDDDVVTASIIDGTIEEYRDNGMLSIGKCALYGRSKLATVDLPALTSISDRTFCLCSELASINFPAVTSIGTCAFQGCTKLTSLVFPAATNVDINAFQDCTSVTTVELPALTNIKGNVFYGCTALTTLDFPAVTSIAERAFQNTSTLNTLILRNTARVATLAGTSAFTGTSIKSGIGYIYVPRSFVDTYKSATNWSTYAAQFRALEDYTVDSTVTGELDPNKI